MIRCDLKFLGLTEDMPKIGVCGNLVLRLQIIGDVLVLFSLVV